MQIKRWYTLFVLQSIILALAPIPGKSQVKAQQWQQPAAFAPTAPKRHFSQASLPLFFEANAGQSDPAVKFLAHGRKHNLLLTPDAAFLLPVGNEQRSSTAVQLHFVGASAQSALVGVDPLPGVVNYHTGDDPAQWRNNVRTYAKVQYRNLYPGIDLLFYGNGRHLEHDFVVAPGVDPGLITVQVAGTAAFMIDATGDLLLDQSAVRLHKPVIYQEIDGRHRAVAGGYVHKGAQQYGFQIAQYDHRRPLIIDPVLEFSTFYGGDGDDYAHAITRDAEGNLYITGVTTSVNFPVFNPAQPAFADSGIKCPSDEVASRLCYDIFVMKINAALDTVLYATYLGDKGDDLANAITVDGAGNAYITGQLSTNSELMPEYYINKYILVAKLDANGAFAYVSWFGHDSQGHSIAVDAQGNAYVTGEVHDSDFPTTSNAIQSKRLEIADAFVAVLRPDGQSLLYSTYLGGSGDYCEACYSIGHDIALGPDGLIYVTGQAAASFPTTPDAVQPTFNGYIWKAFVSKIDPNQAGATGLVYSTLLGGTGNDFGKAIALDAAGLVYVAGTTQSDDFPTTAGAYDRTCGSDGLCNATTVISCDPVPPGAPPHCHMDAKVDVFVVKLDLTQVGTAGLIYATYIGGMAHDTVHDMDIDGAGNVYVVGDTKATDYPLVDPLQTQHGGNEEGFITKLNATGSALGYSTYLGGGGDDAVNGITVDAAGNVYVTGFSGSAAYPVVKPLHPRATPFDAFIAKITGTSTIPAPNGTGTTQHSAYLPLVQR